MMISILTGDIPPHRTRPHPPPSLIKLPLQEHSRKWAAPSCQCSSIDTKSVNLNSFRLSKQPHFCRGCRRCWTANEPVGGGRRQSFSGRSSSVLPQVVGSGGAAAADLWTTSTPTDQFSGEMYVDMPLLSANRLGDQHFAYQQLPEGLPDVGAVDAELSHEDLAQIPPNATVFVTTVGLPTPTDAQLHNLGFDGGGVDHSLTIVCPEGSAWLQQQNPAKHPLNQSA